jgi:hypothetical protein
MPAVKIFGANLTVTLANNESCSEQLAASVAIKLDLDLDIIDGKL